MTSIPYAAHFDAAAFLLRRRQGMLDAPELKASAVARLERRLRCHLHVLGRVELPEQRTEKPAEFAALLAADLSSPSEERRAAGLEQGCRWLCEGGKKGEGAFVALALFPPAADDRRLKDLYRSFPPLRPVLFRLWRVQGAQLPEFLNGLEGVDSVLQEAALQYAAENPAVAAPFFRPFWLPLLEGSVPTPSSAAALRGALLREEREAAPALRRAVELVSSPEGKGELLRLGVLAGDPALLPHLGAFCTESPGEGVRLLALHGTAEAAGILLRRLLQAPEGGAAWSRLTGQDLLAGAEPPQLAEAAERWWKENRGNWSPGERRMAGRPLTVSLAASLARAWAGRTGRDFFDLAAVLLGRPLGCFSGTWQETRRAALERTAA